MPKDRFRHDGLSHGRNYSQKIRWHNQKMYVLGIRSMPLAHVRGKPPIQYGRGRVCAIKGCGTILNMYNPRDVCSIHEHRFLI